MFFVKNPTSKKDAEELAKNFKQLKLINQVGVFRYNDCFKSKNIHR